MHAMGARWAIVAVFFQQTIDQLIHCQRYARQDGPKSWRLLLDVLVERNHRIGRIKGGPAGAHLEQQATQGVEVAATIQIPHAANLLWCHVTDTAHGLSRHRQLGTIGSDRQAKVTQLQPAPF